MGNGLLKGAVMQCFSCTAMAAQDQGVSWDSISNWFYLALERVSEALNIKLSTLACDPGDFLNQEFLRCSYRLHFQATSHSSLELGHFPGTQSTL